MLHTVLGSVTCTFPSSRNPVSGTIFGFTYGDFDPSIDLSLLLEYHRQKQNCQNLKFKTGLIEVKNQLFHLELQSKGDFLNYRKLRYTNEARVHEEFGKIYDIYLANPKPKFLPLDICGDDIISFSVSESLGAC